ncbi:MAG: hypothetical protein WA210_03350 [Burkholderiaceae bacterium]
MILKKWVASVATATVLGFALLSTPAIAQSNNDFSALRGVDVQALSVQEMQAISGELNAYDIAAALYAKAATLGAYPKLQAAALKLAAYYTTNATAINARFVKLGVFTPCQSCTP